MVPVVLPINVNLDSGEIVSPIRESKIMGYIYIYIYSDEMLYFGIYFCSILRNCRMGTN